MNNPARKTGREISVGDVVVCGGQSRTVTGFDPHPGHTNDQGHHTSRVLKSGDYGITLFDDDLYFETSSKSWIQAHSWFSHERKGR